MTHLAEGPATKSGELGVELARASIATLEHYAVILWAVTALTTVYLIVLPPGADVITGLAWGIAGVIISLKRFRWEPYR